MTSQPMTSAETSGDRGSGGVSDDVDGCVGADGIAGPCGVQEIIVTSAEAVNTPRRVMGRSLCMPNAEWSREPPPNQDASARACYNECVASRSQTDQEQQQVDVGEVLAELANKIERLKTLYEQYFM